MPSRPYLFNTQCLAVRRAVADDAPFILSLWSDPQVMRFVGFPRGLPTAARDVSQRLRLPGRSPLLVVEYRETGEPVGQCLLGAPDECGVCEPDIKLTPCQWGRGYGTELWVAIIDQLFLTTACAAVRGTPNVANVASIRMMEAAGMRRVGEGRFEFPCSMQAYTVPVPHFVYEITRAAWQGRREEVSGRTSE
ncbi:MAG: GNAT family protein [Candidatus Bipolaricaulota bacterium]